MRPGFGGSPVPMGIDVQVESIDSISEVKVRLYNDFFFFISDITGKMRGSFPSTTNKSMTFDRRLIKKIWVPDIFFVHSKRSFIHDKKKKNLWRTSCFMYTLFFNIACLLGHMVKRPAVFVFSLLLQAVSAMCFMDFSRFPLDTQNEDTLDTCSLKLESYASSEQDLMLYWKHGNKSLNPGERWYNRLFINFVLRRHIFFFMLQTYFPALLTVMLSRISFWTDRGAIPARVSLVPPPKLITTAPHQALVSGLSTSEPQVPRPVFPACAWPVHVCGLCSPTLLLSGTYNTDTVQAMALDGCYHDSKTEMDQTSSSLHSEEDSVRERCTGSSSTDSSQIKRTQSLGGHVARVVLENNHVIDTYSRIFFPIVCIIFNLFYWGIHV
ncbi:unnamed protein product [Nyctereutes procyonoides]|uniref:(raccoon dog) hypothetical protein n=1 Tax=Nyctereutes procyonoides TaxID=34880 RepID=A0A811Y3X1_NYCPR|nr:unnamed protein product [Nyctereutes procyonoides]